MNKPAIFELKENENFKDLKEYFGGFLSTTYLKRAKLDRINSVEERIKTGKDRIIIDISLINLKKSNYDFSLLDGEFN